MRNLILKTLENEIDYGRWDEYVQKNISTSIYHLSVWKHIIHQSFRHKTHYLFVEDAGKIVSVLPLVVINSKLFGRNIISMPFVNYGGLVSSNERAGKMLISGAVDYAKQLKADYLEFRHVSGNSVDLPSKGTKVSMVLALAQDSEVQFSRFKTKQRTRVRKAYQYGFEIRSGGSELLDDYYEMFARGMRRLGTPVYGKQFFAEIVAAFPSNCRIFSLVLKDQVVGAAFMIRFRDRVEIPWSICDSRLFNKRPNEFLYWEMIQYACRQKISWFDFGRSTVGSGTYQFKSQWGACEQKLVWYYWHPPGKKVQEINPLNPKYHLAIAIWKKLPLWLTNTIGPYIVKNIP